MWDKKNCLFIYDLLCQQSWNAIDCLQLVRHQFERIRYLNICKVGRIVAHTAFVHSETELGHHSICRSIIVLRNHPTLLAHMNTVFVRNIIQSFSAESAHSVCKHNITLHLSNSKTAITTTAFGRLSCEIYHRSN